MTPSASPSVLRRALCLLAALVPTVVGTTAGTAAAGHVTCGTAIVQNTVLDSDVGPCASGGGLLIVANNITLDLNGHRVFGRPGPGDGVGIKIFRNTGVTVKNGAVSGFDMGVAIEGGGSNTIERVHASGNIGGAGLGGDGIAILSSRSNTIRNNTTINNGPLSGIGLYSQIDAEHPRNTGGVSTGNVIESNLVHGNIASRDGNVRNTDNDGIRIEPDSAGNFFLFNNVTSNGLDGIVMFVGSNNNVVRGNYVARNGFWRTTARRGNGIGMQSLPGIAGASGNLIEGNRVIGNGDNGIVARGPRGGAPGAVNNIIRNNVARGNGVLPPVSTAFGPVFDLNDDNPDCDNNVWENNDYGTADPPCAGG